MSIFICGRVLKTVQFTLKGIKLFLWNSQFASVSVCL